MTENRHYDSFDAGPEWGTPKYIVKPLSNSLKTRLDNYGFDLDPASGAEPEPYAKTQYTIEDDGLAQEWFGHIWLNPPYGREHNRAWSTKVWEEWQSDRVDSITALVPASTETSWFQSCYAKSDALTFLDERVEFVGAGDSGASFPSVIATFGLVNLPGKYVDALKSLGAFYPQTEEILRQLVASGNTPAQALDYYFTEVAGYTRTDWAKVRGVSQQAISDSAGIIN